MPGEHQLGIRPPLSLLATRAFSPAYASFTAADAASAAPELYLRPARSQLA